MGSPAQAACRIARAIRGNTGAKAAADIVVLTLFARAKGLPLATLLGVPLHDRTPAIFMLRDGQSAALSGDAILTQVKVIRVTPAMDAAAIAALRGALRQGPSVPSRRSPPAAPTIPPPPRV